MSRPDESLGAAFALIDRQLHLTRLLSAAKVDLFGDRETWICLKQEVEAAGKLADYTVRDFSQDGTISGKVTVTTHHSSKGRQFGAVIIPELVQQIFPAVPWIEKRLKQERRLFYVAFTRAKRLVSLVYGNQYRKRNGAMRATEVSQFVRESPSPPQERKSLKRRVPSGGGESEKARAVKRPLPCRGRGGNKWPIDASDFHPFT